MRKIPKTSHFNYVRLTVLFLLALLACNEYYEYCTNPSCGRLGQNLWLVLAILQVRFVSGLRALFRTKVHVMYVDSTWTLLPRLQLVSCDAFRCIEESTYCNGAWFIPADVFDASRVLRWIKVIQHKQAYLSCKSSHSLFLAALPHPRLPGPSRHWNRWKS